MKKPILNVADVELHPRPPAFAPDGEAAKRFEVRTAQLSGLLGAQKLGYNISSVPSGKAAYPFHSHRVNEEMFFVLHAVLSPTEDGTPRYFYFMGREKMTLDYWADEGGDGL